MMKALLTLLLLVVSPVMAASPDAAAALASDLSRNALPADLRQMRLTVAVNAGDAVIVAAQPAIGGPLPDPADAAAFLCGQDSVPAFLDQGGAIKVLMIDAPFLTLSTCEGV